MSSFVDSKDFRSIYKSGFQDFSVETLDADASYANTLKLSVDRDAGKQSIEDILIANKTLINRSGGCVDAVRLHDSYLDALTLVPYGDFGIKLKGMSSGNRFADLLFTRPAKKYEIELGQFDNYWYPGRPPTSHNSFYEKPRNDFAFAVGPVRIILWDADDTNEFVFTNKTVKHVPKWQWYPYFLFRFSWLRIENAIRKLRGIAPIPTS